MKTIKILSILAIVFATTSLSFGQKPTTANGVWDSGNKKDSCDCKEIFDMKGKRINHNEVHINKRPLDPSTYEMWEIHEILLPCEIKSCGVRIIDVQNRLIFREKIDLNGYARKGIYPFMFEGGFSYYDSTFFPIITIPGVNDQ